MDYMIENEPSPENCRLEEEKQAIGAYNKSADAEFYSKIPNTLLTFSQIHTIIPDWRNEMHSLIKTKCKKLKTSLNSQQNYEEDNKNIDLIEVQLLRLYFSKGFPPRYLSNKLNMTRSRLYKLIRETKIDILKADSNVRKRDSKRESKLQNFMSMINEYIESNKFKYYTLEDIRKHLMNWAPPEQVPCRETIRKAIKQKLRLSYKKISTRPLKLMVDNKLSERLCFINFYSKLTWCWVKLIQLDEFTVNSSVKPSRAWTPIGKNSFIWVGEASMTFNIILAISEIKVLHYKISQSNTNSEVFIEFLKELTTKIKEDSEIREEKFILNFDNASYHKSKVVKSFINKGEIKAFTNVPYTPEFAAVELWINCIKNSIRKEIRWER